MYVAFALFCVLLTIWYYGYSCEDAPLRTVRAPVGSRWEHVYHVVNPRHPVRTSLVVVER